MTVRVRDFNRAHPSAHGTFVPVLGPLEDRISRIQALSGQQQGGYLSKHWSEATSVVPGKALNCQRPPSPANRWYRAAPSIPLPPLN